MVELLTTLAGPFILGLLSPIALELLRKRLNRNREDRVDELETEKHDDTIAAALRSELRQDNQTLREENLRLKSSAIDHYDLIEDKRKWQEAYYAMKKEKGRLDFELELIKQELRTIKEQYDEYIEIRERAENQFRDDDGNAE